jgi:preprotein translocase subunit YajC
VLAQQASDGSGLVLPLAFLALLYVLLIRPQAKRRKELSRLVASLRVGDLVASVGGIHGRSSTSTTPRSTSRSPRTSRVVPTWSSASTE